MENTEKYFYIFTYIDGTTQEFEQDNNTLSTKIVKSESKRIQVDNVIVNLDNVIKVTVETKTERDEQQRQVKENTKASIEALSRMGL
ncbi:hypothetical protein [Virgibacillus salexigens]|uniref:hypothetical protein n=1 Tax=Virgibacillus salexigens TaxID=61016 RepID=UPI0019093A0E|nr:hypothetical protein [Virgibacillus salexigens]